MAVRRVIGWIFLFAIGWIFCLAGLWVLVRDYKVLVDTGDWSPITLYDLWWNFHLSSLNLVWAVTQRYMPFLWNPVIFPVPVVVLGLCCADGAGLGDPPIKCARAYAEKFISA